MKTQQHWSTWGLCMRFSGMHLGLIFFCVLIPKHSYSQPIAKGLLSLTATNNPLAVQPSTCVTLHEGRACFATIQFTWTLKAPENVCLYQMSPKHKINCRQHQKSGQATIEFESNSNKTYQLISTSNTVLAMAKVEVNWVYKSTPRKRRWRIF